MCIDWDLAGGAGKPSRPALATAPVVVLPAAVVVVGAAEFTEDVNAAGEGDG